MITAALEISDIAVHAPGTYLAIAGLVALDAVLPIAPSETLMVAAGVAVSEGPLSLGLVVLSGFVGALAGHSVLYLLGTLGGPALRRRLFRT